MHLPVSLLINERQVPIHFDKAWMYLLIYSAVNATAFWMSVTGFKHVDASIGSLIGLTEILFGVVFGAILFHEHLSWTMYLGGAIILFSGMLTDLANVLQNRHRSKPEVPVPL